MEYTTRVSAKSNISGYQHAQYAFQNPRACHCQVALEASPVFSISCYQEYEQSNEFLLLLTTREVSSSWTILDIERR